MAGPGGAGGRQQHRKERKGLGKSLFVLTLVGLTVARVLRLQLLPLREFRDRVETALAPAPEPVALLIALMPLLISVVLLGAALWVILARRYGDATQKWAFGAAGSILGYWLNTGNT